MKTVVSVTTFVLGSCLAGAGLSDQVFNDDVIVDGRLCAGPDCAAGDLFNSSVAKFKSGQPDLQFDDTSGGLDASRDWRIQINEAGSGGQERFAIKDDTADQLPFLIEGSAPDNSVFVATSGHIGLGTSLPEDELHIVGESQPAISIESTTSGPTAKLRIGVQSSEFFIQNGVTSDVPFSISTSAPNDAIVVRTSGHIGLGTDTPDGKLHTKGDGVQLAYFESGDGGPVQVRFRTNSENRRFLAVNNADEVKSQIIFGDDEIKFTGATDSGTNLWLSIGPSGIISQGPTCGSPCDLTFDPDHFTVPPIEERAAYMWDNMHLPAIGPTSPGTPINLTEKTGGIIHELEVAHIYIERLHARLNEMQNTQEGLLSAQAAKERRHQETIDALTERLNKLEARP